MNRRWLALIGILLAALVVAPVWLVSMTGSTAEPSPSATGIVPTSSPSPSVEAPTAIAFTDAESPEDAAWYRIGADVGLLPQHIHVGTMADGVTFDFELPLDPRAGAEITVPRRPVLGVGDGVVVIVVDNGRHSTMRAVIAATGDVHDLLVSDDVIVDGVLDPDGRVAYYATADRLTGDLIGAWMLDVGDARAPEPIDALVSVAPDFRLAAVTRFFTRMLLSADGTTLAMFRCIELDCALRTVRAADGSLVGEARIPRGGGDPFAITSEVALLRPIVPDGPHRIGEVVDLASGATAQMPFEGWPFGTVALVEGADGPVMVGQTAGFIVPPQAVGPRPEPPEIALFGLPDMMVDLELRPALAALAIVDSHDDSVGVDLPPGWALVRGSEVGAARESFYAMSVEDGHIVQLPAVGELMVQG